MGRTLGELRVQPLTVRSLGKLDCSSVHFSLDISGRNRKEHPVQQCLALPWAPPREARDAPCRGNLRNPEAPKTRIQGIYHKSN